MLEFTKSAPRLVSLLGGLDSLKSFDSFDKEKCAPDAIIAVKETGLAVASRNDNECAAGVIPNISRFQFPADMVGDASHVIHDGRRVFENVFVYFLMDVT